MSEKKVAPAVTRGYLYPFQLSALSVAIADYRSRTEA